jgi:hypothetical protein
MERPAPQSPPSECWWEFIPAFATPEASAQVKPHLWPLLDALRKHLPTPPSEDIRELWVYLIIQGETPDSNRFCRDTPTLGRYTRRSGSFALHVFLPSSIWFGAPPRTIREAWAHEWRRAFRMIVERAVQTKLKLDGDRFLADLEAALAEFLAGTPATSQEGDAVRNRQTNDIEGAAHPVPANEPPVPRQARPVEPRRRGDGGRRRRVVAPELITLAPDDSHLEHVGRLADGRGYFATTAWVDQQDIERTAEDAGVPGEYIAIYIFNRDGSLAEARIEAAGDLDADARDALWEKRLSELGRRRRARIKVAPFVAERSGVRFGLVATPPDGADDDGVQEDTDELGSEAEGSNWRVTLEPGATLVFFPPWDGTYDT